MKKTTAILAIMLLMGTIIPAAAQESTLPPNANRASIESNLLNGLASDNIGLQRSCALLLGKIRSNKAMIPLMRVLHTSSDVNLRTAAAYSLCRIGNSAGTYAVKMAARFDDDISVRLRCAWYYETYVAPGTFAMRMPDLSTVAFTSN
jgi:HEAT repeat protein